ncbi:MAG: hypothetical protein IKV41_04160 [Oscillospiraceae bacterium]|nr:hypothetical protein [Oscillospiraceae bacterium]
MKDFTWDLAHEENGRTAAVKQVFSGMQSDDENGDIDDFIFADEEYHVSQR